MSARELATASGVSPSTVTRIDARRSQPDGGDARAAARPRLAANSTSVVTPRAARPTLGALRPDRAAIVEIVESFGAGNVRVFGSVARDEAGDASDVDLLIDVPAGTGLITIERITEAVEEAIPWRVDVVTSGAARGRMAHVLDEAVVL